jgi:hypothetical protein
MIQGIFDQIKAKHPANFPIFLGERHLASNSSPPRIVHVPGVESYSPPEPVRASNGEVLKSVIARGPTLDVHFWGKDLGTTEGMLHDYLVIVHDLFNTSLTIGQGQWVAFEKPSYLTKGEAYILPVTFRGPVVRTETFAVLAQIAHEFSLETEI